MLVGIAKTVKKSSYGTSKYDIVKGPLQLIHFREPGVYLGARIFARTDILKILIFEPFIDPSHLLDT